MLGRWFWISLCTSRSNFSQSLPRLYFGLNHTAWKNFFRVCQKFVSIKFWYVDWDFQRYATLDGSVRSDALLEVGYHLSQWYQKITRFCFPRIWWWNNRIWSIYSEAANKAFYKKGVVKNLHKSTRKHMCQSLSLHKVQGFRSTTLSKTRLWHKRFVWTQRFFSEQLF